MSAIAILVSRLQLKCVLLTGARAPAALEWARLLNELEVRVIAADSVSWPITRFSNAIAAYEKMPAPRTALAAYVSAVNAVCQQRGVDLIIPCCEEVFYLSQARLHIKATVFAPPIEVLKQVHSKWAFAQLNRTLSIQSPETRLIDSAQSIDNSDSETLPEWVLKPVWSRFATQTIVSPSAAQFRAIEASPAQPWVLQRKAEGKEYCSYSFAINGQVLAHTLYQPKYRVGKGAGIYFEPIVDDLIEQFVIDFCRQQHWTGQVAFDFMVNDGDYAVLECNPRATSGVHLLRGELARPKCVGLAMLLFARPLAVGGWRGFIYDFLKARDVVSSTRDRWPVIGQVVSTLHMMYTAVAARVGMLSATTLDTEWNGEDFNWEY